MDHADEQRFLNHQGQLEQWPAKHSDKRLVLSYLAGKFELSRSYAETEINALLKQWHTFDDWPLLRRELVVEGFFERTRDGSDYHLLAIATSQPELKLVVPNVERDAAVAVTWMAGDEGRNTLRLMGNTDERNKPSTLKEEQDRLREFIVANDQRTWMLAYNDQIIGAIWVSLTDSDYLKGPSIHLMIGDPKVRGRGIGSASIKAVLGELGQEGDYQKIYSRYLISNLGSKALLHKLGFALDGPSYEDGDHLAFQNVVLTL